MRTVKDLATDIGIGLGAIGQTTAVGGFWPSRRRDFQESWRLRRNPHHLTIGFALIEPLAICAQLLP
jgi:hypothetical protein